MDNIESREIELVPHGPFWENYFVKEAQALRKILKSNVLDIHHIGSTAIPQIVAKPTLDILCVVHTIKGIELFKNEFEKCGFTWKGEHGIPGRLYFVRLAKDGQTHLSHIHLFVKGNPLIGDHLDFRDYLNSEEEVALEYENLKKALKDKNQKNPGLYQAGKNEFIKTVLRNLN